MPDQPLRPDLFSIDTALLTRNCLVRRLRERDGAKLYRAARASSDYLHTHHPRLLAKLGESEDAAETFVRFRLSDWLLQRRYTFGVWDNSTTELVGMVELYRLDWQTPAAALRIFIEPGDAKGERVTEVLARIIRFGFLQLALEKVHYTLLSDNFIDQRLIRKLGLVREGDLRNEYRKGTGQLADAVRFGLSRETYAE